jgi:hypothetical protein
MGNTRFTAITVGCLVLLLCSCSTTYKVTSEPSNAAIYINWGTYRTSTPAILRYSNVRGRSIPCTVIKEGYIKQTKILGPAGGNVHFVLEPNKQVATKVDQPKEPKKSGEIIVNIIGTREGIELRRSEVHAEKEIIERSPNVTAVRRLTNLSDKRWLNHFVLFPTEESIIMEILDQKFVEDDDEEMFANLWSINTTGKGGIKRITQGNYFDCYPSLSRNGEYLYFSSDRTGTRNIWRLSLKVLSGLELITSSTTSDSQSELSPDDKLLIYTARMSASRIPQLWITPIGRGLPIQLRDGFDGHWSSSGKQILFSAIDRSTGKVKIWTMLPNASSPTQISNPVDCNDITPRWSPNGKQIIFASDRGVASGKHNYDIWIMGADGSDPRQLTTNGSRDDQPIFSQDGTTVYFRSNRGLKWDVWVMQIVADE